MVAPTMPERTLPTWTWVLLSLAAAAPAAAAPAAAAPTAAPPTAAAAAPASAAPATAPAAAAAATPLPPAVPGIPIGCYAGLAAPALEDVKAAGFEFAEIGLRNAAALSDAEFEQLLARLKTLRLPVLAAINFLPPELKVVGPEVDKAKQDEYLTRAFARAERLGLKAIVFGSGRSRTPPEGFSPKEASRQLVEFSKRAAGLARKHKLTIGIEPLGAAEAGTINSVAEAVALTRAVNHPAFGITIDYYHLTQAGEPSSVLLTTRNRLYHVRVANPKGRAFPLAASEADYAGFFDNLARIRYRGAIGLEARTGTITEQGRPSVAFLRTAAAPLTAGTAGRGSPRAR